MHAENLQILSKEVLAGVLEIPLQELKKKVLGPLGEEAAIATTGRMVFTRHRAIANTALQILSEKFDVDSDNLYIELAQSALQAYQAGTYVPSLNDWDYMSSHFFEKGDKTLGIKLAQAMQKIAPLNPYLIVNLSKLYRKAEQPEQSVRAFRLAPSNTKRDRAFYYEWGK